MKHTNPFRLLLCGSLSLVGLAGCPGGMTKAEKAGEKIENASERAGGKIEKAGDKIEDKIDERN